MTLVGSVGVAVGRGGVLGRGGYRLVGNRASDEGCEKSGAEEVEAVYRGVNLCMSDNNLLTLACGGTMEAMDLGSLDMGAGIGGVDLRGRWDSERSGLVLVLGEGVLKANLCHRRYLLPLALVSYPFSG